VPGPPLPPTIADALAALERGDVTAVDLARAAIARADATDAEVGVYIARTDEAALAAAERVDAARAAGEPLGALAGIPLGIKDICATADAPTTAQSLVPPPGLEASSDAAVVARLRAAGAVLTGKTTTMEYAIGCPDPTRPFPLPRNPWGLDRWAGGSSSGTASGVAAGVFLGGIGTDTGGSIRVPAAWCGITGLKPTFGLVPRTGIVPLAWSLDHAGPMARSARDCALLLDVLAGYDAGDPSSAERPVTRHADALDSDVTGLRIGVDRALVEQAEPGVAQCVEEALAALADAGARLVDVTVPLYAELRTATLVCVCVEALGYHRATLRERWDDYGVSARSTFATGALFTATDLVQAQRVRRVGARAVAELLREVDVLASPTNLVGPPPILDLDFPRVAEVVATQVWNAVGLPALSAPAGLADGLPVGLQLVGRAFEDATVLRAADALQRVTDWHLAVPSVAVEASP
jgi:aspartyl-tRNA(Asn)/glutamyl-tRNA(Gln) amidotransferase subunit A